MKVILLFDSDKLNNIYREYEIDNDAELRYGEQCSIIVCHPSCGEMFVTRTGKDLDN